MIIGDRAVAAAAGRGRRPDGAYHPVVAQGQHVSFNRIMPALGRRRSTARPPLRRALAAAHRQAP
jgi:hypothetical protein